MSVRRVLGVMAGAVLAVSLSACGSGAAISPPGRSVAPSLTAPSLPAPSVPNLTPAIPVPNQVEGLCGAFPAELAVAALGGPVDEPSGGDVVPRPNGIYCHYVLTGTPNTNVEAQLKEAPRTEFEGLAEIMGADIPLAGVGEAAFRRDTSSMGGEGVTVVAWADGKLASVIVNREGGDQATVNAAAEAVAKAVLLATP